MILWISPAGHGVGLAKRIHDQGDPVTLFLASPYLRECGLYRGLVPQVESLDQGLRLHPRVVVYDLSGHGREADALAATVPVWGAGRIQDALEENRGFGIEVMVASGIRVPETVVFDPDRPPRFSAHPALRYLRGHRAEAQRFVRDHGGRWVLKPYDASSSLTYVADDPEDLCDRLDEASEKGELGPHARFLVQRFIEGVEISTEVWISHGEFLRATANATVENKRFMPDGLGPNTGSENSVVWPYDQWPRILKETWGTDTFSTFLRSPALPDGARVGPYHGPLDLNTIISHTDRQAYGIEWTPRMGWNAYYALLSLYPGRHYDLWVSVADGRGLPEGFAPGVACVLKGSIPPYPASEILDYDRDPALHRGMMELARGIDIEGWDAQRDQIWLLDARREPPRHAQDPGGIVTAGCHGMVYEATGTGATFGEASVKAAAAFESVHVADKQGNLDWKFPEVARHLAKWGYDVPRG